MQLHDASKNTKKNASATLQVDPQRCPQDHVCPAMGICPVGALTQVGFAAPQVDDEKCILCGKCVRLCPKGALALK